VEAALQLKDMYGGKVTVLTMGPPQAEESLKKTIAYGEDEAILLSDRKFAGSDTLATSYILAQAIRKLGESEPVDIIFCGKQAIDGDTAQVGPGIATRLGIPQLTYVIKIDEVDLEKGEIQIHRKLEALREVVRAKLPALLTVEKSLNEIRYASLPNMIKAAAFKVTVLGKDSFEMNEAELGLKGSPTWVGKIFAPPQREIGEMLSGGESAVPELVDRLVKTKIIANI
jgi:electron transfer flavoprotein beta subunit